MTGIRSPFLTRINKRDSGYAGRKAEGKLADRLGGRQRPGSGALAGAKGDVEVSGSREFLIENKTSQGESVSIKKDWLLKIYQEALEVNKTPALSFQFVSQSGASEKRERWVAIPEHVWQEIFGD